MLELEPSQVKIALKHGIGKSSAPAVAAGEQVQLGGLLGDLAFDELGSLVHSSISGVVVSADETGILVRRQAPTGGTIAPGRETPTGGTGSIPSPGREEMLT
jgi:hypothetical protein